MNIVSATVEQIGSKMVTTKFGQKATYSIKANGVWYNAGFKKPLANVGDDVTIEYETGTYGNEVKSVFIDKKASPSMIVASVPSISVSAPARPSATTNSGKGVFPIPPLDGQRSIIRQNALTNARELVLELIPVQAPGATELKKMASLIIETARSFEAYSAGDLDAQEVADEAKQAKAS